MRDVDMIPTKELVDELADRFTHFVIYGIEESSMRNRKGQQAVGMTHRYKGNMHVCLGLCSDLENVIGNVIDERRRNAQK